MLSAALRGAGSDCPPAARQAAATESTSGRPRNVALPAAAAPAPAHYNPDAMLAAGFERVAAMRQRRGQSFEARPAQREMAARIFATWRQGGRLILEAGTGLGKSLAYALPTLLQVRLTGQRAVFSTYTRTLQRQLQDHDLPEVVEAVESVTGVHADEPPLRLATLYGRERYYCRTALLRGLLASPDAATLRRRVERLVAYAAHPEGLGDDGGFPPADAVFPDGVAGRPETCLPDGCEGQPPCPVHAARARARAANVVLVNHALLFADAAAGGRVLGPIDLLVIDEGHHVPEVAVEAGTHVIDARLLDALGHGARAIRRTARGMAVAEAAARDRLATALRATAMAGRRWFRDLDTALPARPRWPVVQRYRDADEVFGATRAAMGALEERLSTLEAALTEAIEPALDAAGVDPSAFDGAAPPSAGGAVSGLAPLAAARGRVMALHAALRAVQDSSEDRLQVVRFDATSARLAAIESRPLDGAAITQARVERVSTGVLYTSATLDAGGGATFRRAVGEPPSTSFLTWPSPFEVAERCFMGFTPELGDRRDPEFLERVAEFLAALHTRVPRRMLVLLTAYAGVERLATALRRRVAPDRLLVQDAPAQRGARLAAFRRTPAGILLGTRGYWEGIDLPGADLEIVVIPQLPFAVPDDPWNAARAERARAQGEDPFETLVLPEATLRLRQGVGRLLRVATDRGACVLLDARMATQEYGPRIAAALPVMPQTFPDAQGLVEAIADWFADGERRTDRGAPPQPPARSDACAAPQAPGHGPRT